MYKSTAALPLHELVARLERTALDEWRNAHASGESLVDALATHADKVITKLVRHRGGYISVTVSIECNRPYVSDQFWFSLQNTGKQEYAVLETDSTLTED
jgi:hypothetical protein